MKKIWAIGCFVLSLACAALASASTLSWDRNTDDAVLYKVYGCFTSGCTVTATAATLQGTVPQPAAGVTPTFTVDITGKAGAYAVLAEDAALNDSGLSVSVPFDKISPSIPAHPILQ